MYKQVKKFLYKTKVLKIKVLLIFLFSTNHLWAFNVTKKQAGVMLGLIILLYFCHYFTQ